MRHLVIASALLALPACGQPPAESPATPTAETSATPGLPAAPTPSPVEGWETSAAAYPGVSASIPEFSGRRANGDPVTRESLRGRWTILGFDSDATVTAEETAFISALNSASDQDPDLDFLQIYRLAEDATRAPLTNWPSLMDAGMISEAFALAPPALPAYLLIGPDLTIEGYRGALSATPGDGIKPVIRGVAEIRKQVAAPQ